MATFRNQKNVHLAAPVEVHPSYDDETRTYVTEMTGKDATEFRKVAADWGYIEDGKSDKPSDEV